MADSVEKYIEFIQEKSEDAAHVVAEWDSFLNTWGPKYPELYQIQSVADADIFYNFRATHPEAHIDFNLWNAFELKDAYRHLSLTPPRLHEEIGHDEGHGSSTPHAPGGVVTILNNWLNRPRIVEEDEEYKRISEELKTKWLASSGKKDFTDKEGLDFLYGPLEGEDKKTLHSQAEEEFRKRNPKKWEEYQKYKEKIHKDPTDDRAIQRVRTQTTEEFNARVEFFKQNKIPFDEKALREQIEKKHWDKFARRFGKKAQAYRTYIDKKTGKKTEVSDVIDKALTRIHTKEEQRKQQEQTAAMERKIGNLGRFARHEPIRQPVTSPPPRFVKYQLMPIPPTSDIPLPQIPQPSAIPQTPGQPSPQQSPTQPSLPRRGGNLMNTANNLMQNGKQLAQMAKNVQKLAQLAKLGPLLAGLGASAPVWVPILVVVIVVIFLLVVNPLGPKNSSETSSSSTSSSGTISVIIPAVAGLTLSITADPPALPNFPSGYDLITYTITATYVGDKKIMLYDPLSPEAQYMPDSAEPPLEDAPVEDPKTQSTKLTWFLEKYDSHAQTSTSPEGKPQKKYILKFKIKPKVSDIVLVNTIYGQLAAGETIGEEPPSGNNCNGLYSKYMGDNKPTHLNFGDPTCELVLANRKFDSNAIASYLTSGKFPISQTEALQWYITMFFESTYNANAILINSKSGEGAYGLLQMNPIGKGNGIYDQGDVVWRKQIENAINHNQLLKPKTDKYPNGQNMCYWQPSICLGYSVCTYPDRSNCVRVDNPNSGAPTSLP